MTTSDKDNHEITSEKKIIKMKKSEKCKNATILHHLMNS